MKRLSFHQFREKRCMVTAFQLYLKGEGEHVESVLGLSELPTFLICMAARWIRRPELSRSISV